MLKIKKGVDLKELEKFGFRPHKKDEENVITSKWVREWIDDGDAYGCKGSWDFYPIIKVLKNKAISIYWNGLITYSGGVSSVITDTIYDLIQAGVVEKVVD